MSDPVELTAAAIQRLDLPNDVKRLLAQIAERNADANRTALINLTEQLKSMNLRLDRLQSTVSILLDRMAPTLKGNADKLPVAFTVASSPGDADLAKAVVVADPIAQGFTLTQKDLGERLGLDQPTVSVLVRGLGITNDANLCVAVRRGRGQEVINYHLNAVDGLKKKIAAPPSSLPRSVLSALRRAQKALLLDLQLPR